MSKFTKGPWYFDKYRNLKSDHAKTATNAIPFSGVCLTSGEEAEANTMLASAAPDMHDELKSYISLLNALIEDGQDGYVNRRDRAQKVLAKADGKGE